MSANNQSGRKAEQGNERPAGGEGLPYGFPRKTTRGRLACLGRRICPQCRGDLEPAQEGDPAENLACPACDEVFPYGRVL